LSKNHALLKRKPRPPRWKPRRQCVRNGNQRRRAIVRLESVRKVAVVRRDQAAKVEDKDHAAKVAQGREIARPGAVRTADVKVAVGIVVTTGVVVIAGASKVRRKSTSRS
jgi:hypothetical protein